MGWICKDCGNRELFLEVNEFETLVQQESKTTSIVRMEDTPLGTTCFEPKCFKCGSLDVAWVETKDEILKDSVKKQEELLRLLKDKFICKQCENCCKYIPVYPTDEEILKIEEKTGMKKDKFQDHNRLKSVDGKCIFLKNNKCSIYEARPRQCRFFPFVEERLGKPPSTERFFFCKGLEPFLGKYQETIMESGKKHQNSLG